MVDYYGPTVVLETVQSDRIHMALLELAPLSFYSRWPSLRTLTLFVIKSTIFWDITPCSPLKVSRRFGGTYHLHLQGRRKNRARNQRENRRQAEPAFTLVFCSAYSSTMKMQVIRSSKTSAELQRAT
jgi:hypothetical protein